MRVERTATYVRLYLGRLMLQWNLRMTVKRDHIIRMTGLVDMGSCGDPTCSVCGTDA